MDTRALGLLALGAGALGLAVTSRGHAGSRSLGLPDLSFASLHEGQRVEGGAPYRAGGVTFDSREGAGSTSNNQNVDYLGMVVWLRPSEFLALNPDLSSSQSKDGLSRTLDAWVRSFEAGVQVGPPMLYVAVKATEEDEDGDPLKATFVVKAHEGRHRMAALRRLSDEPVPVHVVPGDGLRARHLRGLDLHTLRFASDVRAKAARYVRPHAAAVEGLVRLVRDV